LFIVQRHAALPPADARRRHFARRRCQLR
jgi:hypothetical protein